MFATGVTANLLDRELGGVLRLGRVLFWTINTLSPDERRRHGVQRGPRTMTEAEDLWAWRDKHKWLKNEKTEADTWDPIQLFVMGENRWRGENERPIARTR
jgi:hypothetical protein